MRRAYLVLISVGVAAAVLAVLLLAPVIPTVKTFNFSGQFPTGTTYFNGQERCGPNVTISDAFPLGSDVKYSYAQNESGADVNIWMIGPGFFSFDSTGGPGSGHGELRSEAGLGSVSLIFKACGPGPVVDLGFWGNASYFAPVL